MTGFNFRGVLTIYRFELARFRRTLWTSLATPVFTTSLYFVVFVSAIGPRLVAIGGIDYGSFIVPGLIMLSMFPGKIGITHVCTPVTNAHIVCRLLLVNHN